MPAEDSQPESSLIELPILGGPQPAPLRRYDWRWLPLGVLFCGLSLLVGLALQVLSLGRDPRGLPLMLGGSLGLALALVMINPTPRTRYPLSPGQTVLSPAQLPRLDGLRLERLAIDVRDLPGDRSGKRVTVTARAAVLDDTPQHIRVMLSGDASDDRAEIRLDFSPVTTGGPAIRVGRLVISFTPTHVTVTATAPASD